MRASFLKYDDGLDMRRIGKQIERVNPRQRVSPFDESARVPRERRDVARHVDDPRRPESTDALDRFG